MSYIHVFRNKRSQSTKKLRMGKSKNTQHEEQMTLEKNMTAFVILRGFEQKQQIQMHLP